MAIAGEPARNAAFRTQLRRDKIAAREALGSEEHARASRRIDAHLDALLGPRPVGAFGFCWPIRKEFDCRPLAARLIARGWQACIPTVIQKDQAMQFRAWTEQSPMARDPYGIPIPAEERVLQPDVVLLPLVAFDVRGFRLGYGGGYFDRTLAQLVPRPYCIGVGFELGRVESIVPEPHDIPLDAIVTESGSFTAR